MDVYYPPTDREVATVIFFIWIKKNI